jgi:tripartite-type tricarboxylate transporter receptor subunit TctC
MQNGRSLEEAPMKMTHRLGVLALLFASAAGAQQYPSKPIRMYVPNPPGGATDTLGRLIAPRLGESLGQPVLIENRAGSNGNLATESAARAAPDGYVLLLAADAQIVISPHLYRMAADPVKELAPVASLVNTTMALAINANVPARSLQEFIEHAKRAKPPLAYASIGNGSQHHLVMEMLKARANVDMVHIPYKGGGPAMLALIANEVSAMFGGNSVSGQAKAGKVRVVALAGRQRSAAYPDVPTLSEFYPGVEVSPWLGIFAPAATAAPVMARLRGDIAKLLADEGMRDKMRGLGGLEPYVTTPEEFSSLVKSEYAKYGEVVKAVGVKVD